jgi:rhodanese-related sulfurtransferase
MFILKQSRRPLAAHGCPLLVAIVAAAFMPLGTAPVLAYDQALAASYDAFFGTLAEQNTAKMLQLIPVEKVVEAINAGEDLTLLDVRTRKEMSLIGLTYPGSLAIPMSEIFKPENLARIPTDKRVVVTCHSGVRCTAVALALRNIGFANMYSMKGGLMEFMKYLDAKTAFATASPPPPAAAAPPR